jgi:hypothetical protein
MTAKRLQQILATEAGSDADPSAIAAATRRLFDALARDLANVIGDVGVLAVFGRGLHLARRQLPWLPSSAFPSADALLAALQACLAQQATTVVTEASLILLTINTQLLEALVGAGLTSHLLSRAWPERAPDDTSSRSVT